MTELNIDELELLSSMKEMISEIREFAYGPSDECSNYDKYCFWLWFCYNFRLYQEGGLIFRKIDKDKVSKELYNMVSLLGSACEEKGQSASFKDPRIKEKRSKSISKNHNEYPHKYMFEVVIYMKKENMSYEDALIKVSKDNRDAFKKTDGYASVRDKCTRYLGINTDEFKKFVLNGDIKSFLLLKFPTYKKLIEDRMMDIY